MNLKNKKVTVVGFARTGMSAATLLYEKGAVVSVSDSSDSANVRDSIKLLKAKISRFEIGAHSRDFVAGQDLVVISPGVPLDSPVLQWAKQLRVPVFSEIELGYSFCDVGIIAVTGSNGKSTTTTLIGEIFKCANKDVVVCGNIGKPFCDYINSITKDSVVALEISSAQLEAVSDFKPKVSIMLNLTPNHLDRYKSFDEYCQFKLGIFKNQSEGDYAILNFDDPMIAGFASRLRAKPLFFTSGNVLVEGAYIDKGAIYTNLGGITEKICRIEDIKLKGPHNMHNCMAAILSAKLFNIQSKYICQALYTFAGLPHRVEYVATISGVDFINDSKSTTVDATVAALNMQTKPVVLIAGGKDKGADYSAISGLVKKKVKALVLIGKAKDKIENSLEGLADIKKADTLKAAVSLALEISKPGYAVVLSPMCSSFDMFRDYEDRGDQFKQIVKEMKNYELQK